MTTSSERVVCDWQSADDETKARFPQAWEFHKDHVDTNMSDCDAIRCVCRNSIDGDGFAPCNDLGVEVEPTPEDWPGFKYVCLSCGRIVQGETGAIVGRVAVRS